MSLLTNLGDLREAFEVLATIAEGLPPNPMDYPPTLGITPQP